MRLFLIAAATLATLSTPAVAQERPLEVKCKRTLAGGERCVSSDGHVTQRTPLPSGGEKTTTTRSSWWGRSNGHGGGWTPPDAMMKHSPYMIGARGRVSEPWEPRRQARPETGFGVTYPNGRSTRCVPDDGKMRCTTR